MNKTPTTLIIMDGFGLRSESEGNAVTHASTPVLDGLLATCAHTTLSASGLDVGLPDGQMGNSEVGHTNIIECLPGPAPDYPGRRGRLLL